MDNSRPQIAWPPMLYLSGLSDQYDSATRLKDAFKPPDGSSGVTDAYPGYGAGTGFTGEAVLFFTSPGDQHATAFEKAIDMERLHLVKLKKDRPGLADLKFKWVEEQEFEKWSATDSKKNWAGKMLKKCRSNLKPW